MIVATCRRPRRRVAPLAILVSVIVGACAPTITQGGVAAASAAPLSVDVTTIPLPDGVHLLSATYTPSGRVLISYSPNASDGESDEFVRLATMNDDGTDFRPFLNERLAFVPKNNGIRFMIFADNRRIFTGDYIVECMGPANSSLDNCPQPVVVPVAYPAEVAGGDDIAVRWSEIVVAPDNRHIAWTTLLANYSAVVFTGALEREAARYRITSPQIISTLDPFHADPAHADGRIPEQVRGGEVKQFVEGGRALSLAGAAQRDLPGSVVQDLASGTVTSISNPAAYTETTIFSPDERLGLTMSTRFSQSSDPGVLALLPRPYPASLNMGLAVYAYTYAVTGVRRGRPGSVGPVILDLAAARANPDTPGINLSLDADWVFSSPMSWHPSSERAMWIEGRRDSLERRIRVVRLSGHLGGASVPTAEFPRVERAITDLSVIHDYARRGREIDLRVYGRHTGYINYRRTNAGLIEKRYENYSDDGQSFWSGSERTIANPLVGATYVADVRLTGNEQGRMDIRMSFGPLGAQPPAAIIFAPDEAGVPQSRGYAEYRGQRREVAVLVP